MRLLGQVLSIIVNLLSLWGFMSFRKPTFNLTCNIWRAAGGLVYAAPDVAGAKCNLSPGKRVLLIATGGGPVISSAGQMELLLDTGTDIRAAWNGGSPDWVEVPAGSKRIYAVTFVDDVAKGFANEYRIALIEWSLDGGSMFTVPFAFPVPLP